MRGRNKKISKLILIIVVLFIATIFINSIVMASSGIDYKDYEPNQTVGSTKLQTMAGRVLGTIRNVGIVVAIIALSIIGVKYMIGSVEQKAEYKKSLIPLVVGIIMLVAGTTLVSAIYNLATTEQSRVPNLTDDQIDYMEYQRGYSDGQSYQASHTGEDIDKEVKTTEANVKKYPKNKYYQGYLQGLQY